METADYSKLRRAEYDQMVTGGDVTAPLDRLKFCYIWLPSGLYQASAQGDVERTTRMGRSIFRDKSISFPNVEAEIRGIEGVVLSRFLCSGCTSRVDLALVSNSNDTMVVSVTRVYPTGTCPGHS